MSSARLKNALLVTLAGLFVSSLPSSVSAAPAHAKMDQRLKMFKAASKAERKRMKKHMGVKDIDTGAKVRIFVRLRAGFKKQYLKTWFPSARFFSQSGGIVTAEVPVSELDTLAGDPNVESLEAATIDRPELDVVYSAADANGGATYLGVLPGGLQDTVDVYGSSVVLGFVDTGIDYTHADFHDITVSTVSRILWIWDQTDAGGPNPANYLYGTEWTQAQINNEIDGTPVGVVREVDTVGHGTHVAGIAAGNGNATDGDEPQLTYIGMAPKADIIMVKTDFVRSNIIDGVNYIIEQASAADKRAIISLSLGGQSGPHDGTDSYESALNTIAASTPIVKSAGNDNDDDIHALLDFSAAGSTTVVVDRIGSPTLMQIEFWHPNTDFYDVTVTTGSTGMVIASSGTNNSGAIGSDTISIWNATNVGHPAGDKQILIQITGSPVNAVGFGIVFTRVESAGPGRVDGFTSPSYGVFDDHLDGRMNISEPGNAENIITVGAYCSKYTWTADDGGSYNDADCNLTNVGGLSDFSGRGPTRDGRTKPDITAPGQRVAAALSSQQAPPEPANTTTLDGRHSLKNGTSMAAPVVAGALALRLQLDKDETVTQLRTDLATKAEEDDKTNPSLPDDEWGYGKLLGTPPPNGTPVVDVSTVIPHSSSVTWRWDNGATNHSYVSVLRSSDATNMSTPLYGSDITSWTETGLTPNTSYSVFIVVSNDAGDAASQMTVATRTLAALPAYSPPTDVAVSQIRANWAANSNPSGTEFYAERATDQSFTQNVAGSGWTTAMNSLFSGLSTNTTYYLRVKARNAVPVETGWTVLTATPTLAVQPGADLPTGISSVAVTANWLANGNPDGTRYRARVADDAAFTNVVDVSTLTTSVTYPFTGLTPNTTYYFDVRAINHSGIETLEAGLMEVMTLAAQPDSAASTGVDTDRLTAHWGPNNNPGWTEYYAELAEDSGFTIGAQNSGWTSGTSHLFVLLSPNVTYYLRVRARSEAHIESAVRDLPTTVTSVFAPAADVPAFISSGSITADWVPNGNPAGTLYKAEIALDSGFTTGLSTAAATDSYAAFHGLTPDTTYYFQVRAVSHSGEESAVTSLVPTLTGVEPPGSLEPAGVYDQQMTPRWGTLGNPPYTEYFCELAEDLGYTAGLQQSGWVQKSSHTFFGLKLDTTYYTHVKARNRAGTETVYTDLPSTMTLAFLATLPPTDIEFSAVGPTDMTVDWKLLAPSEYPLWVLSAQSDFSVTVESMTGTAGQESRTFLTLSPNTTYFFKIKVSTASDYFFSAPASTPTHANTPGSQPPTETKVDSMQINWSNNSNPSGTEYLVQRATDAAFTLDLASSPWITETNHTFVGLTTNTLYHLRVYARNFAGVVSSPGTFTPASTLAADPLPGPPTEAAPSSQRVNWYPNENPDGTEYLVERTVSEVPADVSPWITTHTYVFSGLTPNTTHHFRVRGRSFSGLETNIIALADALTLAEKPGSDSTLSGSTWSLTARWSEGSNPDGTEYYVERSTVSNFTGALYDSGWIQTTTYAFTDLTMNTRHFFRVRARNHYLVETDTAALPYAVTMAGEPASLPPAQVSATSVTVQWGDGGNPAGTAFLCEASTAPDYSGSVTQSGWNIGTSHQFLSMTPNTTYYFRVRARNLAAVETSTVALPTVLLGASAPAPLPPSDVGTDTIRANWGPGTNPTGTEYYAEAAEDSGFTVGVQNSGWITVSSHAFTGLSANTTYYFRVIPRNSEGTVGSTTDLPEYATDALLPGAGAPSAVWSTSVTVNWTSGGNPGGTLYKSQAAIDENYTQGLTSSPWTTAFSYTLIGMTPNASYRARVYAKSHNTVMTSSTSLPQTVTLSALPASAVPGKVLDTSVLVNWGDNGNPVGTEYYAQRATDNGYTLNVAGSGWTPFLYHTFSGLTPDTTYYFRVKSRNQDLIESDYTVLPSTWTPLDVPVPKDVRYSSVGQGTLTAEWGLLSPDGQPVYGFSQDSDFISFVSSGAGAVGQESITFSSLSPNTTYFFRVKLATAGDQYYSVPIASATLPNTPGGLSVATQAADGFSLLWAVNSNPSGTRYVVEVDSDTAYSPPAASSETYNAYAAVAGLDANTRYYARVRALHKGMESTSWTADLPMSTLALAPIAPPGEAILSVTYSSITAVWTALPASPSSASAEGYVLQASASDDYSDPSETSQAGQVSILAVGGLDADTTYWLRAGSINIDGDRNWLVLGSTHTFFATSATGTASNSNTVTISVTPDYPQLTSVRLTIPAGSLPQGTTVEVDTGVSFLMPPAVSNQARLIPLGDGVGLEITTQDGRQPLGPVSITMVYDPDELPPGYDPDSLVIAHYRTDAAQWSLLPGSVDAQRHEITAVTNHFSLFAPFISVAGSDLDQINIFPVPWEPGAGSAFDAAGIQFTNLPALTRIRIYSLLGEKVFEKSAAGSGTVSWDGYNMSGRRCGSGTYLAVMESEGSRKVKRVVIIR